MPSNYPNEGKRSSSDDIDLGRLCSSMQRARLSLRRFREERREAVRQYVGRHWSEEGARQAVPINLVALYCQIVGRSLIAKDPRIMLSTFDQKAKPVVSAMERWMNDEIEESRLAKTLQRVVLDSLFSIGIAKIALATPSDSASLAWNLDAGEPFVARVDLDDFVFDVHARDFSEVSFIGHRYRAPLDTIRDSKLYNKARKQLAPSSDSPYNLEGDERIHVIGQGYYTTTAEEFEDHVDLWEIYLPRHKVILTLADDNLSGSTPVGQSEALRQQRWLGPDSGPYHVLGLFAVPGAPMPKAPIQDLLDLHIGVNHNERKLMRQAERQKEILIADGAAGDDTERVINANDGDAIKVNRPDAFKVVAFGSPNQANFLFNKDLIQQASWAMGNLDIMGGLSPQSKTLGQDQMLNQNSSLTMSDMQATVTHFVCDVAKSMLWFQHHNPFKTMRTAWQKPGLSIPQDVTPEQRFQVPFDSIKIRVDPYSLQHTTPEARVQKIMSVLQGMQPFMQLAAQQGVSIDLNVLVQKIAKYYDEPDLIEILTVAPPPEPQPSGGGDMMGGMPAQTERTYTRRSLGQNSPANQQAGLISNLMSGSGQNGSMGKTQ